MIPANEPMAELPEGFSGLRAEVGSILKNKRKALGKKQSAVAEVAGIRTESLSRIENHVAGRLPKLETVAALIDVLSLDWEDVALKVQAGENRLDKASCGDVSYRKAKVFEMGADIRDARRAARMSLRDLSERSGISASQLSRLERGLCGDSGIYQDAEGWENDLRQDRLIEIGNEVLARLVRPSQYAPINDDVRTIDLRHE